MKQSIGVILLGLLGLIAQGQTHNIVLEWQELETIKFENKNKVVVAFEEAVYESSDLGLPSLTFEFPFSKIDAIEFLNPVYVPLDFFVYQKMVADTTLETTTIQEDSVVYSYDSSGAVIDSTTIQVDREVTTEVVGQKSVQDTIFEKDIISSMMHLIDTIDNVKIDVDSDAINTKMKVLPFIKRSDGTIEKLKSFSYQIPTLKSSVFASDILAKIKISESGVYKIDKKLFSKMGIDISNINPRTIKVYGNGGGMLPQANSSFRYNDIVETPIKVIGESDGVFNDNDYVLFYGKAQHEPYYNEATQKNEHSKNIYTDDAYYFVSVSPSLGKRIPIIASESTFDKSYSYYDDYQYHENDLYNLIISGRDWVGEKFSSSNPSRTFNFSLSNLEPSSEVEVVSTLVSTPVAQTSFSLKLPGLNSKSITMQGSVDGTYGNKARESVDVSKVSSASISGNLNVSYTYNVGGSGGNEAYLNRIVVRSKRLIKPFSDQTFFTVLDSKNNLISKYKISNFSSNYEVWDVSDVSNVKQQSVSLEAGLGVFSTESSVVRKYLLLNATAGFKTPVFVEQVQKQNLHGSLQSPDMIIIAPTKLILKAHEYAALRNQQEGITSWVVDIKNVFNEFSSGAQDVSAVRDFVRMMYYRTNKHLKYLLLFGDASYDYKNRIADNTNLIPTYQADNSYHNVDTYASDDYFGFMEIDEGSWVDNHTLDIGVGRFPVTKAEEADIFIEKAYQYISAPSSIGKWRTAVTFVADDDDNTMHMDQANQLAEKLAAYHPEYNTNKIFLDAFEQIATPSGKVSPNCASELDEKIEKGSLIVNYTGHGSEVQWTKEEVFNTNSINKLRNFQNLPLFVTATCEFGRYDDPELRSGAEELLLNAKGGAIAMLTTTRPVYALSNFAINGTFYDKVFEPLNDTLMPTLGQVIMMTKNNSFSGTRNRNFTLLGDPSITLAYPKKKIKINEINEEEHDNATISALGLTKIKGEVTYLNGNRINDFNGQVSVTVYDKESKIRTLGDEGNPFEFRSRNNLLYEGKSSVKNGAFEVDFVVPKDISYQFDKGKISMYAFDSKMLDAIGVTTEVVIGGTDTTAELEYTPPMIRVYMDSRNFVNGDLTDDSPLLIADIYDANGINVSTSGLGHELIAIIDGDESQLIILNDFYSSNLDNYKSGQINYPFKDLEEGKHTLTVRAWDTHNNVGEASIYFEVNYSIATVYSYPNPMQDLTTFVIEHSREGEEMEVEFDLYSPQGDYVLHKEEVYLNSDQVIESMTWDGTDEFGVKLQGGVYYYKMTLRYTSDNFTVTKMNRLVLID